MMRFGYGSAWYGLNWLFMLGICGIDSTRDHRALAVFKADGRASEKNDVRA